MRVQESRRALLKGQARSSRVHMRPPWALAEAAFIATCERCDACVDACGEGILLRGDGGFPQVRFAAGRCTFCVACVDACAPAALVRAPGARPWSWHVGISTACLGAAGVECRVCAEHCDDGAIRFPLRGRPGPPEIDSDRCTRCGACIGSCPVAAAQPRLEQEMTHA